VPVAGGVGQAVEGGLCALTLSQSENDGRRRDRPDLLLELAVEVGRAGKGPKNEVATTPASLAPATRLSVTGALTFSSLCVTQPRVITNTVCPYQVRSEIPAAKWVIFSC
jgi:hypothetical protein